MSYNAVGYISLSLLIFALVSFMLPDQKKKSWFLYGWKVTASVKEKATLTNYTKLLLGCILCPFYFTAQIPLFGKIGQCS